ncbi:MAG: DUF4136 domain-containing protein [Pseudomonadales bacterium]|jgi:hypothetical protein
MGRCTIRLSNSTEHGASSLRSLVSLALLVLGACAVTPQVDVVRDPAAAFQEYATFMFHTPLHTDRPSGEGTVLSQRLRALAERELAARGCGQVSDGADLEVNFFVETRERIESVPDDEWGFHYGYWGQPFGYWYGYRDPRLRQYTVGTLHLDVVDTARRQLVWEAVASDRVTTGLSFDDADLDRAVTRMFESFPRCRGLAPPGVSVVAP